MKKVSGLILSAFFIMPAVMIYAEAGSLKKLDLDRELYSGFTEGTISADNVNVREKPDSGSKVISRLKRGQSVKVKGQAGSAVFAGKFFGVWLRVDMPAGREGYVLSCFVSNPEAMVEPFHLFFDRFKKAWQEEKIEDVERHVVFPLELILMEEGTPSVSKINPGDFFINARISEPFMYSMMFKRESVDTILVTYGYEAQQFSLYFAVINGSWTLYKIRISSC